MRRLFIAVLLIASAAFVVGCRGLAYRSPTNNMRPTVTPNDLCVANPVAYSFGEVQRFDLVIFSPDDEQRPPFEKEGARYLKRVIGLPSEKIEIRDNEVLVDDTLLPEPFDKIVGTKDPKRNFGPIIVPQNEYFVMGDNRPESSDGRYWKHPTVNRDNIHSKIVEVKKDYYE